MKRSLSHTTTKRKDDKKQERKFEKKNQNKKEIKIIALSLSS